MQHWQEMVYTGVSDYDAAKQTLTSFVSVPGSCSEI
jgi:hypothetical protein